MRWRTTLVDGTFGDRSVILTVGIVKNPRKCVLLYHGVHSSASAEAGNKYARIGRALAEQGVLPVLVETSRKVRNRRDYAHDELRWIFDAFGGKTYEEELQDAYNAFQSVKSMYPALPMTLWGFSLGGLSALLIAGGYPSGGVAPERLDGLVLCGSGDEAKADKKEIFRLPILNSLENSEELHRAARRLKVHWVRCFRGTEDSTFSSEACRRLFDSADVIDKAYAEIPGADHSLRMLHGALSQEPLQAVFRQLPQLFIEI